MKGFVLGGTESGVGKTVATLVTGQALEASGRELQPAKAGPDFIDPSHHTAITGKPSRTLDSDARFAFEMKRGKGVDGDHEGLTEYQTLGTYCHLHAESGAFDRFLERAAE